MPPHINVGVRQQRVVSLMSWLLNPGVKRSLQTEQEAGWASRAGLDVLEKTKIFCPSQQLNPLIIQPNQRRK